MCHNSHKSYNPGHFHCRILTPIQPGILWALMHYCTSEWVVAYTVTQLQLELCWAGILQLKWPGLYMDYFLPISYFPILLTQKFCLPHVHIYFPNHTTCRDDINPFQWTTLITISMIKVTWLLRQYTRVKVSHKISHRKEIIISIIRKHFIQYIIKRDNTACNVIFSEIWCVVVWNLYMRQHFTFPDKKDSEK